MAWRLEWANHAIRDMRRLDRPVREQLLEAIERFVATGLGDVIALDPPLSGYRLRYRDWRVSFDRDRDTSTITIRRVRRRDEAYKRD